jgi:ATP-dependent DNA helicase RecG
VPYLQVDPQQQAIQSLPTSLSVWIGGQVTPPVTAPVTAPVSDYVLRLIKLLHSEGPKGNAEIRKTFDLRNRRRLRDTYIGPALTEGLIEYTLPDKPASRLQNTV